MKTFRILFLSALFLGAAAISAQNITPAQQAKINEAFKNGKIAYFKFSVSSMQEVAPLSKIITIEKNQGRIVYAHATKPQFAQFISKGYPYTLIKSTKPAAKIKSKTPPKKK
jgi:hypothetical protein